MSSTTAIQDSPTKLPCTLPRVHVVENTTEVNAEARAYLEQLIARCVPAWHAQALCREFGDLGPWFPARGQSSRLALEVCGHCPARPECLAEALGDPSLDHGIRGGATAAARKTMRQNRQRQSANDSSVRDQAHTTTPYIQATG